MTLPSPYEQGFRDALLTIKAQDLALDAKYDSEQRGDDDTDMKIFREGRALLDALIDQKNIDLWNLFAVAEADLSAYPEAQALRDMLRAPSGVLIDSAGRMLFLRLHGTEYDTGVLALLEEVTRLKAVAEPKPEMMTVIVNGLEKTLLRGIILTYADLCSLAAGHTHGPHDATITYHGNGYLGEFEGTLTADGAIVASPGTVFNVVRTGSA